MLFAFLIRLYMTQMKQIEAAVCENHFTSFRIFFLIKALF